MDPRLVAAVIDNARWCEAVCAALGRPGRFDPDAWVHPARTPPGYPDAVTLRAGTSGDAILARVDASPGCSVKDSFADVDLAGSGFRVLLDGSWFWRPPGADTTTGAADALRWHRVEDADALRRWAADHGGGDVFAPPILGLAHVHVLRAVDVGGRSIGGAVATVGETAVGISNVFAQGDRVDAFAGLFASATAHIAATIGADLPIVGYLDSGRLETARAAGHETIGPLRVWFRDRPPT